MNENAIVRSTIIALILFFVVSKADAIDYPHFGVNNIGCDACHFVSGTQPSLLPEWTAHTSGY